MSARKEKHWRYKQNAEIISFEIQIGEKFGDVPEGENIILKDDYGRVEIAKNLGSFISEFSLHIGDRVMIKLSD